MDETARLQWLVRYIVPHEPQARAWLFRHVRTLSQADADDLIQEAYARLWSLEPEAIANPRGYFVTVIRNLVAEQARRAKIVPMERMGEIEALNIIRRYLRWLNERSPPPCRLPSEGARLSRLANICPLPCDPM